MKPKQADRRALIAGVGGVLGASLLIRPALAGSIKPPPGPIRSTGASTATLSAKIARTAGVAEPRTSLKSLQGSATAQYSIVASGSYYLVENIQGVAGLACIEILADNVDLDLGGFHLYGAASNPGTPGSTGIVTAQSNVTVYNGSLIGWGRGADFGQATQFVLWDVTCIGAQQGAFVLGGAGQAYDCDAYSASGVGFGLTGANTLVEECGAWTCATGFKVMPGSGPNLLIRNCATQCAVPYDLGQGNSYGPIVSVVGVGDISAVPNTSHPEANYVY